MSSWTVGKYAISKYPVLQEPSVPAHRRDRCGFQNPHSTRSRILQDPPFPQPCPSDRFPISQPIYCLSFTLKHLLILLHHPCNLPCLDPRIQDLPPYDVQFPIYLSPPFIRLSNLLLRPRWNVLVHTGQHLVHPRQHPKRPALEFASSYHPTRGSQFLLRGAQGRKLTREGVDGAAQGEQEGEVVVIADMGAVVVAGNRVVGWRGSAAFQGPRSGKGQQLCGGGGREAGWEFGDVEGF